METNFRLWLCWGFPLCFWWAPAVLLFFPFSLKLNKFIYRWCCFWQKGLHCSQSSQIYKLCCISNGNVILLFPRKECIKWTQRIFQRKFDQMQPGCWTQRWKSIWGGSVSCPCRFSVIVWVLGYHTDPTDFELFASFVFCLLTMLFVPLNLQKFCRKVSSWYWSVVWCKFLEVVGFVCIPHACGCWYNR